MHGSDSHSFMLMLQRTPKTAILTNERERTTSQTVRLLEDKGVIKLRMFKPQSLFIQSTMVVVCLFIW